MCLNNFSQLSKPAGLNGPISPTETSKLFRGPILRVNLHARYKYSKYFTHP